MIMFVQNEYHDSFFFIRYPFPLISYDGIQAIEYYTVIDVLAYILVEHC